MARESGFWQRSKRFLRPVIGYLQLLFGRGTPWRVRVLLAAGMLYLLSPYDLLPDWILGLGIIDDVAVVSLIGWLAAKMMAPEKRETTE